MDSLSLNLKLLAPTSTVPSATVHVEAVATPRRKVRAEAIENRILEGVGGFEAGDGAGFKVSSLSLACGLRG